MKKKEKDETKTIEKLTNQNLHRIETDIVRQDMLIEDDDLSSLNNTKLFKKKNHKWLLDNVLTGLPYI